MSVVINGSAGVTTNSGAVYDSIQSATAKASTSGTSVEFTSIPSWVKRITVMFQGVSTNGTNALQVQIGTGGSATISGYLGGYIQGSSASAATLAGLTTGFFVGNPTLANATFQGSLVITLLSSSANTWTCTGNIADSTNQRFWPSSGSVSLGGSLNYLRIIGSATGSPSDTFDAGTINILFE
jgi:hypothetical protein